MWAHFKYRSYNKNRPEANRFAFCMAPFTSLHFSYDGRVYACHNNHTQTYGNISNQSISEIWESSLRKEYQRLSKVYKMQKAGCFQCVEDVSEGHYAAVNAHRYDTFTYSKDAAYPAIMGFKFSDVCNLNCIMCYSNHHKSTQVHDAKALYNDVFFEELKLFIPHLQRAYLLGGEPFCEPLNLKLLNLITELNPACKVTIQTNGTLLTEDILRILEKGTFEINVSVDSLNKATFESIRKGASFDLVMANIHKLHEICTSKSTLFGTCVTPMRMNWRDIPEIINYFSNKLHSYVWLNKYYFPARYSLWSLNSKEIMHITDTIRIEKLSTEDTISKENAIQFQSFITSLDNFYKAAILRENDRQDVCRKTMLIADKHIHILGKHIYIDKKDAEKILKNLNFIKSLNTKKAFYYLSFFTAYFSGDKLFDILSVIDETFLEEDIDTIMF